MSTHCAIIAHTGERWEGIYIHHDGYLEGVGAELNRSYRDRAKVLALMARGDRSGLTASPDDHAYVDDGEPLHITKGDTPEAVSRLIGERYVYVLRDDGWHYGLGDRLLSAAIRGLEARRRWTGMTDSEANDYLAGLEDSNAALRSCLEKCAAELRQLHAHHYPGCGGGCPSDAYIAEAARLLGKEPKGLRVW